MPELLVINPKRKGRKKTTRRKRKKLTAWQKAVKKYGGMKEAKKHYKKKTTRAKRKTKKRTYKKNAWTGQKKRHQTAAKKGWSKKRKESKTRSEAMKKAWQKKKKKPRKKTTTITTTTTHRNPTRRKRRKGSEWSRLVKRYGVKEAKKHYGKKRASKKRKYKKNTPKKRAYKKRKKYSRNPFVLNPNGKVLRKVVPHAQTAGFVILGLLGARLVSNFIQPWLTRWIPSDNIRNVTVDIGTVAILGAPLIFPRIPFPGAKTLKTGLFVGALTNLGIKLIANFAPAGLKALLSPIAPVYAEELSLPLPPAGGGGGATYGLSSYVTSPTTFFGIKEDLTLNMDIIPYGDKTFENSIRNMGDE